MLFFAESAVLLSLVALFWFARFFVKPRRQMLPPQVFFSLGGLALITVKPALLMSAPPIVAYAKRPKALLRLINRPHSFALTLLLGLSIFFSASLPHSSLSVALL